MMTCMKKEGRLLSIDLLRGFDMFVLLALQPLLLVGLVPFGDASWAVSCREALTHVAWEGFSLWDMVMPLFLFVSGASLPFALKRYKRQGRGRAYVWRLLRRVVLLWVLGMVVQGNLLEGDGRYLRLYSNTLQAIAAGYLVASLAVMYLKVKWQLWLGVALLTVYAIPMYLWGDFTPHGNWALWVDHEVLGRFSDGVYWTGEVWHFSEGYTYTWVWSSLTFSFTVLSGAWAGMIVGKRDGGGRTALQLLVIGLLWVLVGWSLSPLMPIVKRIWTSTMAIYSSGWCFVLFALFYYLFDVKRWAKPFMWLRVYGMNAIVAYVVGETINFRPLYVGALEAVKWSAAAENAEVLTLLQVLTVWGILWVLYRCKIWVKV